MRTVARSVALCVLLIGASTIGCVSFAQTISRLGNLFPTVPAGPVVPPPSLPPTPNTPSPANGATGVGTAPTLTCISTGATTFTLTGPDLTNPPTTTGGSSSACSFPQMLSSGQTYYWTICPSNSAGAGPCATFSFSTGTTVLNAHPRLRWNATVAADLAAKAAASDPDWLAFKNGIDAQLSSVLPRFTVTSCTNANPVECTITETVPFTGTNSNIFIAGGTGSWAGVNSTPNVNHPNPMTATRTGTHTFTIAVNSTGFGSFSGQTLAVAIICQFGGCGESAGFIGWGSTGDYSLLYLATGTTAYRTRALEIYDWLASLGKAGLMYPVAIDSGRDFGVVSGFAGLYDELYQFLTTQEKNDGVAAVNNWNEWKVNQMDPGLRDQVTGNYWEGFTTAYAAAGYATFEENAQGAAWIALANSRWATQMVPAFAAPQTTQSFHDNTQGAYYGGLNVEGFNYGSRDIARHVKYALMVKNATGTNLFATTDFFQRWARALLYERAPDRWQSWAQGRFTGNQQRQFQYDAPLLLAYALAGTTEGQWMQQLYNSRVTAESGYVPDTLLPGILDNLVYFKSSRTATDYALTEPPYRWIDGLSGTIFWRPSWSDTSAYLTFGATPTTQYGEPKYAGHLDIWRGTDALLVDAAMWKGTTDGIDGDPQNEAYGSGYKNTLYFDGDYCFTPKTVDSQYYGCGLLYGKYIAPLQKLTADYAFAMNNFAEAYDPGFLSSPADRSLKYFIRAVMALGDGYYAVYDRVRSTKSEDTKQLRWNVSSLTTPTVSGNAMTQTSVGASDFYIDTWTIPQDQVPRWSSVELVRNTTVSGGSNFINWRIQVTDTNPGVVFNNLTVFQALAHSATKATVTPLTTIDSNFVGVQIGNAKVAVFPHAVTNTSGVYTSTCMTGGSYVTTHTGTADYTNAGFCPGSYTVRRGGTSIATPTVAADGTFRFSSTSGVFTID